VPRTIPEIVPPTPGGFADVSTTGPRGMHAAVSSTASGKLKAHRIV
jgi:hypothetical protein